MSLLTCIKTCDRRCWVHKTITLHYHPNQIHLSNSIPLLLLLLLSLILCIINSHSCAHSLLHFWSIFTAQLTQNSSEHAIGHLSPFPNQCLIFVLLPSLLLNPLMMTTPKTGTITPMSLLLSATSSSISLLFWLLLCLKRKLVSIVSSIRIHTMMDAVFSSLFLVHFFLNCFSFRLTWREIQMLVSMEHVVSWFKAMFG